MTERKGVMVFQIARMQNTANGNPQWRFIDQYGATISRTSVDAQVAFAVDALLDRLPVTLDLTIDGYGKVVGLAETPLDVPEVPSSTPRFLASAYPASRPMVDRLLDMPVAVTDSEEDGRSEWTWLRLFNGDLMLGFFPLGEAYEIAEGHVTADYQRAVREGTLREIEDESER